MVSLKVKLDSVACAEDRGGRQGGAAPLLHQGGSVTVPDRQGVIATGGMRLNVERCEL